MIFYGTDGKIIDAKKFVEEYSKEYFIPSSGEKRYIPGLRRSSEYIEEVMNGILRDGINTEPDSPDVARILAWKIGKIRHGESKNGFVYSKDWVNAEQFDAKLYGNVFPLKDIDSYIKSKKQSLIDQENPDYQGILKELENKDYKRIGTVYMITLLYFLSQGEIPIYDRFAMLALSAIMGDVKPTFNGKVDVKVDFKELPAKKTTEFETVMSCEMKHYTKMLTDVFGDEWKTDRRYDQALWAYGHLFKPV